MIWSLQWLGHQGAWITFTRYFTTSSIAWSTANHNSASPKWDSRRFNRQFFLTLGTEVIRDVARLRLQNLGTALPGQCLRRPARLDDTRSGAVTGAWCFRGATLQGLLAGFRTCSLALFHPLYVSWSLFVVLCSLKKSWLSKIGGPSRRNTI